MPVGKGEEDKSLWKRGWFWETLDVWGQLFKNHDFNFLFESFMTILKQEAKCCLYEYTKWLYIQLQRQPEGWLTGLPFPWRMEWSGRWVCGAPPPGIPAEKILVKNGTSGPRQLQTSRPHILRIIISPTSSRRSMQMPRRGKLDGKKTSFQDLRFHMFET